MRIWTELRQTARSLGRSPGFTLVAVLTLALGIGANAAVFGLVDAVLLRRPPYADPDRLLMVWQSLGEAEKLGASAPEFVDYRDRVHAFSRLAGWTELDLTLTGDGEPERIQGARATASLFPTLGVSPALGRTFTAEEDRAGGARVVVLGYGLWQRRFGGDAGILGRTIRLNEQPYTVVGVMPKGFEFPWRGGPLAERAELWVPMAYAPAELAARAASFDTRMVGRLRAGATLEQARADVARIAAQMIREHPETYSGNVKPTAGVDVLARAASEKARPLLLVLLAAVGCVLLIACANVAGLLLSRAIARRREIAVRRALCASGAQVVRHALLETLLLAAAGGAAGVALAFGLVAGMRALAAEQIAGAQQAAVDGRVLAASALLALTTALLCAVAPALRWLREDPQSALRHAGRQIGEGRERQRLRQGLVVLEAASAMVLLVGAGLLLHSFVQVLSTDPGFDPHGVAVVRTAFDPNRYPEPERRRAVQRDILERLRSTPGVGSVALATHIPLADERTIGFVVEGQDPNDFHWAANALVSDDYFRAMRIPLLRGRGFGAQDAPDAPEVVVINETLARRYWPGEDPLGRAILWGGRRLLVVGIAGDVRVTALDAPVQPTVYSPIFQTHSGATRWGVFLVRAAAGDPRPLLPAVRAAIRAADGELPVYGETTLEEVVSRSLAARRFLVLLLAGFAATALLLAMVGLYGVTAYAVAQRRGEFGVRLAVGARPRDLVRLITGAGLRLAAAGMVLGLAGALAAGRAVSGLLFGVRPLDPIAYGLAAAILLGVAALASGLPALRAARLDPTEALRSD